jgi:leucyl-tRNA synthetase
MYRFLGRIWKLVYRYINGEIGIPDGDPIEVAAGIRKRTHETIKKVSEDIRQRFHFNTAIAAIMEFSNKLTLDTAMEEIIVVDRDPERRRARMEQRRTENSTETEISEEVASAIDEAMKVLVILLSPFVPHVCEELWEALQGAPGMVRIPWPAYDPALLETENIVLVVQINGKKRAEITVAADATEEEINRAALAESNVQKFLEGKTVRKTVLVPGRLLSLVAS